jgi:ribosomal protein S18 acetylase RimI-like enzyme
MRHMGYTEAVCGRSIPLPRGKGPKLNFEVLDIRDVPAAEFMPLLEAESRAWLQDLHWDFSASARVIFNLLGEKRLSGFALRREGLITGYCFLFFDGAKALIGDLFVSSGNHGAGDAMVLLDRAVGVMMNAPGIRRIEAQLPHFRHRRLSTWFRPRFFDGYVRQFMAKGLDDSTPWLRAPSPQGAAGAPAALAQEFRLDAWERKYDRQAARLLSRTYSRHIDAVINDQYGSLEGASRLIENIVHLRGCGEFLEPASLVLIHRPTGEVTGLLGMTAVRAGTAHIAQVAVAAEFQKAGLGRMLLETAMRRVFEQGFPEVSLTVTALNSGAVRLYERLGFQILRDFGAFVWQRP